MPEHRVVVGSGDLGDDGFRSGTWRPARAAADLIEDHPRATLAIIDDAGHALPHERPQLLGALLADWLVRAHRES